MAERMIVAGIPGIFHRTPAPDAPPYFVDGDKVQPGDTIGLVELMKTFLEVKSDAAGVIARFLAEPGQLVDAGQAVAVVRE